MTPNPPAGKPPAGKPEATPPQRASGNPATQAKITLTVKEQREQARQKKLAEYQKQLAKRRRGKIVWWVVGSTAAIAVIAVVAASFLLAPPAAPSYSAGGTGATIEGVETFTNTSEHVQGTVDYPQSPPAGGPHNPYWLNCGIYDQPQTPENAVHSLEHGAIWVTYDASKVAGDDLSALKRQLPSSYVILSPYEGLDSPIVLSGWNHQLKLDSATDARIPAFFEEYWRSQTVPEPNALCTGAIDGPGKQ
ncbi:DUF3105 domain-containing protein [Microbacterium rhizomatis]|uniref:DUF3105 domain-containing protein n=1 Tax=Microbacterium rhizomatis TaxID=1631477 RepID=A0A5J5J026_9MICO|nr:DUF3105 domain-containing protein [Microbacterium rhizomatis]KAA9107657.1 DUF3105 domain-containing protein [Microbacterium rhizomatis]